MGENTTVKRILDAAEVLFADKGFAETSLRAITSRAGVNLAAVNYHFGSKEALIQAVFARFLSPFCHALDEHIKALEDSPEPPSLERLLAVVSVVAMGSQGTNPQRVALFLRLSGLAYAQTQEHLRLYLTEHYGDIYNRFLRLMFKAAPDLSPGELFWRAHFALGATIFTLSGMESLCGIYRKDFGDDMSPVDVNERLLAFIIGGMRARPLR